MSVHSLHKSRLQRAAVHLRQLSRGGPRLFLKRVKDRQQRIRFEQNQAAHGDRATQVTLQAHAFCEEAFTRYVATPYDGDVLYLQAGKQPEWMAFTNETATGGWPAFVKGKLQVQTIDADHHSMLNPEYAAEIATAVKTYLQVGRSSVKDVNRRVCQSGPIRSSEPELIMASRENRTASTL